MADKPTDGDWERWVNRLKGNLECAIELAKSYQADYPDAQVKLMCNEFIIEATAALKDD